MVLNFALVQIAPGGPVEQMIARLSGHDMGATAGFSGGGSEISGAKEIGDLNLEHSSDYRGAQGLDPELIAEIEKLYGFDKPPIERFTHMIWNYLHFDFGESFYKSKSVVDLVIEKLPVSISLGLWTTLITYLISIPLGIAKAVKDGSRFDVISSTIIIIGYAIPSFLFAILLIVLFAGGSVLDLFPLKGLSSDNFENMSMSEKIIDYIWHITLPVISMMIGGFASLTMLTKNSFLEEISKQYVLTARAKGMSEGRVLYGHIFRNAMLIVISGFPDALLRILFTGAILIEVIFSLDGLGLLGFESAINRDYPVMFGTLFFFTLLGLFLNLTSDIICAFIDPRIDFEKKL